MRELSGSGSQSNKGTNIARPLGGPVASDFVINARPIAIASLMTAASLALAQHRKTVQMDDNQPPRKSTRGFASMDPEKQRAIARKGGTSVPKEKRSFSRNRELAASAGRKGGLSVKPSLRSFSRDHELASQAGRKGGQSSSKEARKKDG